MDSSLQTETLPNYQHVQNFDLESKLGSTVTKVKNEPKINLSPFKFYLLILSLFLTLFLCAIDATIVATAEAAISLELKKEELLPWIGSVFLMTSTVSAAASGKLADLFGIKWAFLALNIVFQIGCLVCGVSPSMEALIAGRAIAGIGAGGILALIIMILLSAVKHESIGMYISITSAVWIVSAILGPLVGGAFSDAGLWRWIFYINLPIGIPSMAIVIFCVWSMPTPDGSFKEKMKKLDTLGFLIIMIAVVCLLTALQQGGTNWEWSSAQVIVLLVLAVVFFGVFAFVEVKIVAEPMAPVPIFTDQNTLSLMILSFAIGAVYYAILYYISIYFQVAFGVTATMAGVLCVPFLVGLLVGTFSANKLIDYTGRYWYYMAICGIMTIFFTLGVSFFDSNSGLAERILVSLILGYPIGGLVQLRLALLGVYVDPSLSNTATALSQFFISLGGALSVAIVGTVQNNVVRYKIAQSPNLLAALNSPVFVKVDKTQIIEIRRLLSINGIREQIANPDAALLELLSAFDASFSISMRTLIAFGIIAFLSIILLREKKIDKN
ncbi:hypothetical protein HK096_001669, partial [Nowakowskiella sp. JEL0078]